MRTPLGIAALLLCGSACSVKDVSPTSENAEVRKMSAEYYGLRGARYVATDLAAAKKWYSEVLGQVPYLNQDGRIVFNVGGFELEIVQNTAPHMPSAVVYWGVGDAARSYARLISKGATDYQPISDAGGGIKSGAVRDPFGNIFGIVENPEFRYSPPRIEGPGR